MSPYKMSFGGAGLLLNESIEVAKLHTPGEDWSATINRALAGEAVQLPKKASNRRVLREIVNRLLELTDQELHFLTDEADRAEQTAILWIAICRAYRFIREFAVEVVQDRYLSYQLELPLHTFEVFFENKAEWDDDLSALSASTQSKLRQILFRIMREVGIISEQDQIQAAVLSNRLRVLIEDNSPQEFNYFPGAAIGVTSQ